MKFIINKCLNEVNYNVENLTDIQKSNFLIKYIFTYPITFFIAIYNQKIICE
jgi:hypothetical protein